MEKIILSLGGSLIVPEEVDTAFLKKFKKLILSQIEKGKSFVIVTGGGMVCRKYQKAASEIAELTPTDLDEIGIEATKLNSFLVKKIFKEQAYPEVATNPTKKIKTDKPVIMGSGWKPGCSTDKDAVLFAENTGAKTVINLSNVEYVYDKDPNKFSGAKKIKSLSWKQFFDIIGREWKPGMNVPFDTEAAKLAEKLSLKVVIMKGTDLNNLESFLEGRDFKGSIIK
jgi:uridylate kinase